MNLTRNAARATMESNAHRRSLGTVTLDPVAQTIQQALPSVLPSLTVGKSRKRLIPAVEGKKRKPQKVAKQLV